MLGSIILLAPKNTVLHKSPVPEEGPEGVNLPFLLGKWDLRHWDLLRSGLWDCRKTKSKPGIGT